MPRQPTRFIGEKLITSAVDLGIRQQIASVVNIGTGTGKTRLAREHAACSNIRI
jgi:hypothetical protein